VALVDIDLGAQSGFDVARHNDGRFGVAADNRDLDARRAERRRPDRGQPDGRVPGQTALSA
jgi:hypothetical protein